LAEDFGSAIARKARDGRRALDDADTPAMLAFSVRRIDFG
jgi:hypothetical protein